MSDKNIQCNYVCLLHKTKFFIRFVKKKIYFRNKSKMCSKYVSQVLGEHNIHSEKESAYLVKTEIIKIKINQISYKNTQNLKIYTRRT